MGYPLPSHTLLPLPPVVNFFQVTLSLVGPESRNQNLALRMPGVYKTPDRAFCHIHTCWAESVFCKPSPPPAKPIRHRATRCEGQPHPCCLESAKPCFLDELFHDLTLDNECGQLQNSPGYMRWNPLISHPRHDS